MDNQEQKKGGVLFTVLVETLDRLGVAGMVEEDYELVMKLANQVARKVDNTVQQMGEVELEIMAAREQRSRMSRERQKGFFSASSRAAGFGFKPGAESHETEPEGSTLPAGERIKAERIAMREKMASEHQRTFSQAVDSPQNGPT